MTDSKRTVTARQGISEKIREALGYDCAPSIALVLLSDAKSHPELRAELETFLFSGPVVCHCGYEWRASTDNPTDERCPMCLAAKCRVCAKLDV